jgi:hypothetical protein
MFQAKFVEKITTHILCLVTFSPENLYVYEIIVEENVWAKEGLGNREWRKLHNEELNDLYSSATIVRVIKLRRMRWAGHVVHMREGKGVDRVLAGKPEKKRPLGRTMRRWEDNIKSDLQEVVFGMWGYVLD